MRQHTTQIRVFKCIGTRFKCLSNSWNQINIFQCFLKWLMPSQVFAYLWIWTLSLNWNQIIMSVYLWLWNDSFFKKCSFVNLYRNSCNPKTGTLPGELWTKNSPEVVKWHGKFVKHGQRCWLKTKRAATNSGKRLSDQQVHTSKKTSEILAIELYSWSQGLQFTT